MRTMLSPNTLQSPSSGRSRFSKALPAIPGLNNLSSPSPFSSPPTSSPKGLPELPPPPPPPPPPRFDSITQSRPTAPSRPQLRPLETTSGPPRMAIPRKPVGIKISQAPAQQERAQHPEAQSQSQTTTMATTTATTTTAMSRKELALPPPPAMVSPSESLSSIFSAYSRSSEDSVVKSSEGTASGRESDSIISPYDITEMYQDDKDSSSSSITTVKPRDFSQAQQSVAPNFNQNDGMPPQPPSKDGKHNLPKSPSPKHAGNQNTVSPTSSSPQIWRRRSIKTDRGQDVPSLNLITSNGSTATTQPSSDNATTKPLPLQPPRAAIGGLPGRNVRPVQSKAQEAESQDMGNDNSKLKGLKGTLPSPNRMGGEMGNAKTDTNIRPVAQRPPTPEYQKEDIRTPILETFVSPVSPASSPEPVTTNTSSELPVKQQPWQISPSFQTGAGIKDVTRKVVASPSPEVPTTVQEPPKVPSTSSPQVSAASEPEYSDTHRSLDSARFPPRTSSVKSNVTQPVETRPVESQQSLEHTLDSITESDSKIAEIEAEVDTPVYRGRGGTLYYEMKVVPKPDHKAFYFPTWPGEPIAAGTIITAAPLKPSHFNCYHGHKTMHRKMNKNYSLTCQTCEKEDAEERWLCTFCSLRICEPCHRALNDNGRSLEHLIEGLKLTA